MSKQVLRSCVVLVLSAGIAHAATGKPDLGNYVGSDSLAPAPTLPASFNTLIDVSTYTDTSVTMTLPADGEDAMYPVTLGNVSLYGSALSSCNVSMNGYLSCSGSTSVFDNGALPDPRFSGNVLIAPFWDDLIPISGVSAIDVYTKAANPTVVQWTNFATATDPASRLTFRAVLEVGATGNHGFVAFQYIKMTGGGANGSSATIGIQKAGGYTGSQYAFNTAGATVTGAGGSTTALQSILFGFDTDGDRLNDAFEALIGTDPALHDTDTGGLDDGAELAAGKNPLSAGDDGATTDTDADGLSDADELFYGTDKTKKDTDGDSSVGTPLPDDVELYTTHTNPLVSDSDGDGFSDSVEIDAGNDPNDPTDHPPRIDLNSLNVAHGEPHAAMDSNGNIHVVSIAQDGTNVFYYMIDSTGKKLIPQTALKLPFITGNNGLRYPQIRVVGAKVFIKYEIIDSPGNNPSAGGARSSYRTGLMRINPANAPQDGTAVLGATLLEMNKVFLPSAGVARHVDMQADANGIHLAYMLLNTPRAHGNYSTNLGYAYSQLTADGTLVRTLNFGLPTKSGNTGTHKWTRPYVRISPDGTINLLTLVNVKKNAGGFLWTTIKNNTTQTADVPVSPAPEHFSATLRGSQIYIMAGAGNRKTGYRLMVLDPANVTASPAKNDYWKAPTVIDAGSSAAFGPPFSADQQANQASILPLTNGTAVGAFSQKSPGDICLIGFLPDGTATTTPICGFGGENRRIGGRSRGIESFDLLALPDGSVGFVHNNAGQNELFFDRVPLSKFNFPSTLPVQNTPPKITTMPPPTKLRVAQPFVYNAMATDAETPNMLTWQLLTPPPGMSVTSTGTVTWTPTNNDIGNFSASLQVCDAGTPQRCATQVLDGSVVANGAPIIVSTPPTSASVGQLYAYQLVADDPEMDVTNYILTAPATPPGDMTLSATGLLTWTPTAKDIGTASVTLTVKDATGQTDSQAFSIVVTLPLDIDPQFRTTPANTAVLGQLYSYTAVAVDPGDPAATITYSLVSTPSGNMAITTDGQLTWIPKGAERGTQAITIKASSSSGRSGQQSFSVTVMQAGDGCGCTLGGATDDRLRAPWLLVIAGLAFVLYRRRRAA